MFRNDVRQPDDEMRSSLETLDRAVPRNSIGRRDYSSPEGAAMIDEIRRQRQAGVTLDAIGRTLGMTRQGVDHVMRSTRVRETA